MTDDPKPIAPIAYVAALLRAIDNIADGDAKTLLLATLISECAPRLPAEQLAKVLAVLKERGRHDADI